MLPKQDYSNCIFVPCPHTLQLNFSDPVLSFIPSKKDIRTLSLLKKDVYFQRFKQVNVFVDRSYYGPYYLSLNVFKASKGSTLYILFYSIFHNNSPFSSIESIGKPFFPHVSKLQIEKLFKFHFGY